MDGDSSPLPMDPGDPMNTDIQLSSSANQEIQNVSRMRPLLSRMRRSSSPGPLPSVDVYTDSWRLNIAALNHSVGSVLRAPAPCVHAPKVVPGCFNPTLYGSS
ncbi:unnamed protein product [Danaus chrysippus]|uniref:(African queen) hypothetical protein n=1 Tax=Danaus chrysippus TaxID=151541 RepID=A0A8J2VUJ8_9NEOP|nr:unnamed protein product [Danaus chrysippus]